MTTAVKVINAGLSKLGAAFISSISPPRTSHEHFMADNYPVWRDSELAKRRWLFAMHVAVLTQTGEPLVGVEKPYAFLLPNDCVRPLRDAISGSKPTWERRGMYLYSEEPSLTLRYIRRVPEAEFDPLFRNLLACRIALESAEYVTQSNTKKADADALYQGALKNAVEANCFATGAENPYADDTSFSWIGGRF